MPPDLLAAVTEALARAYPVDVFTELSEREVELAVAAIREAIGPAGSDRLHASWARHLAKVWAEDVVAAIEAATDADRNGYDYVAAALKALKGER